MTEPDSRVDRADAWWPFWDRCPSDHDLAAFADGTLAAPRRGRVARHAASCGSCQQTLAVLGQAAEFRDDVSVPPGVMARARALGTKTARSARWTLPRWAPAGVAAALVLVAGTSVYQRWTTMTRGDDSRTSRAVVSPRPAQASPGADRVERSTRSASAPAPSIHLPADGAVVLSNDVRVAWNAVPDALFYEVRIVTEEGGLVWQGRTRDTSLEVPESIALAPGARHYASVLAYSSDQRTSRSAPVAFVASPPGSPRP